jgi:hypothetical protein
LNMYSRDVTEIKSFVRWGGTDAFVNTGLFVLLTIQAGLSTVKGSMEKVSIDGVKANCLWGKKDEGYKYLIKHGDYLRGEMYKIADAKGYNSVEACADVVELFMQVPNLGMVKASFLAQCLGFNVACIDGHNVKRLGINPNLVKTPPKAMKPETARRKVEEYIVLTQREGSKYWWNTWCEYVAGNKANRKLTTGNVVSKFHVECITYGR